MNIAIFTNNYLPNHYGVTNSIESFRKQLEKRGHTVYIFAPEYKNYQDKNKNVFRFPSLDLNYKIKFPLPIPYSRKINKVLNNLEIDIIHSQHPNLLGKTALRWARKKNIPIVFTWHTLYDQYVDYVPFFLRKISAYLIIKSAVNYADKVNQVIVPTNSVRKIIENWGVENKNIVDMPTGIDRGMFSGFDGNKIRKKLKIFSDKKVILSISRLTNEKNVVFLLKEIIKVLKKNKNSVFVFGGEGYLLKELKKMVFNSGLKERIFFPGIIKKDDIKNYFAMADIFVYASKSETQGMIISEAMYMGLPIVAIKALGIKDLIENKKDGILVSEHKNVFFKAVNELLSNNEKRVILGKNAKNTAETKYTSEVCGSKLIDMYKKTIGIKK